MKQAIGCCEECDHYIYDEEWDAYACEIEMDMDDVERVMSSSRYQCPYYKFRDEYSTARKQ